MSIPGRESQRMATNGRSMRLRYLVL